MLPVVFKIGNQKIEIFDKDGEIEDAKRPLYTGFDDQTHVEFCVLEGESKDKKKTWYRLSNAEGKKKKELFTELTFGSSRDDGLNISTSNGGLEKIDKIYDYFSDLEKQEKYWEILGLKEGADNIDTAWNFKIQVIFSDEKEVIPIITNAYTKLKDLAFVSITLDYSSIGVYLDGIFKGNIPCLIGTPPGEHTIVLKNGDQEISSRKVDVDTGKTECISMPIDEGNSSTASTFTIQVQNLKKENQNLKKDNQNLKNKNQEQRNKISSLERYIDESKSKMHNSLNIIGPSNITLSLLVLLIIMSAIDILSPSPLLFALYSISFIGIFYKRKKLGSGLAMFSGLLSLAGSPFLFWLGFPLMYLGWKEYSVLKSS